MQRYTIVADDSCHRFYIPVEKVEEWYKWVESEDYDNQPDYANFIDGQFSFTDPRCKF